MRERRRTPGAPCWLRPRGRAALGARLPPPRPQPPQEEEGEKLRRGDLRGRGVTRDRDEGSAPCVGAGRAREAARVPGERLGAASPPPGRPWGGGSPAQVRGEPGGQHRHRPGRWYRPGAGGEKDEQPCRERNTGAQQVVCEDVREGRGHFLEFAISSKFVSSPVSLPSKGVSARFGRSVYQAPLELQKARITCLGVVVTDHKVDFLTFL